MKLISNFKDYYDYVIGTYGVDERIVYERIGECLKPLNLTGIRFTDYDIFLFAIAGKLHCLIIYKGVHYYGKSFNIDSVGLSRFDKQKMVTYQNLHGKETNLNREHNCPAMVVSFNKYGYGWSIDIKNPKLLNFGLNKHLPAEEIYTQIVNFLGEEKPFEDKRTDNDKILSNGFDLKSSFRH